MTITTTAPAYLDLAGTWQCRLDPDSVGELDQWFRRLLPQDGPEVVLPGSLQHQGVGADIALDTPWTGGIVDRSFFTDERYAPYREPENISVPFWLQPQVYYQGAAWFQREIEIPEEWADRSVLLTLERVHWESTVWVDDRRIGLDASLSTAHGHNLGSLEPGRHRLTIRVDNRAVVNVGPNAHSVSDHTQGNWNGIVGEISLTAQPDVQINQVRVFPDVQRKSALVKVDILTGTAVAKNGQIRVSARRRNAPGEHVIGPVTALFEVDHGRDLAERGLTAGGTHLDIELPLGEQALTWDEFQPALYDVTVRLEAEASGRVHRDEVTTVFGLREVGVDGTQVTINDKRTFIRGTLESCVFPLTGYPPTDVGSWRHIMDVLRSHGLNLLRFHSWCPPKAAFRAADEAGVYLQVEGPVWANQGAALGEGRDVDAYLIDETQRILRAYGNHPSFIMMAHGNEPGGRDSEFLSAWVHAWRSQDPRRLYTTGAGWPAVEANDFDNIPEPRAHRWGEGLGSRLNATPPETVSDYRQWVDASPRPIISHEIGQWCAHPDLNEVSRYTGLMQPRNFAIFSDFLHAAGMLDQADDFLRSSGRLQALCYKEDIEAALRTKGFAGFHLLGLTDFPGQGTALVGVLNPFWESKGYCTPEEFARFSGPTVPLARLPRRVWRNDEAIVFDAQIAHFGPEALHAHVTWSLRNRAGQELAGGSIAQDLSVPLGNGTHCGPVAVPSGVCTAPEQVKLVLTVQGVDGSRHENDWDLWIFEADAETTGEPAVRTTTQIEEAIALAISGERVLLELQPQHVHNDIALGFTPVFWNTAWTGGQAPHTLGLLHDPNHPLFGSFPTDGATNWQWWDLLHGAKAIVMDHLPQSLRPTVQAIDTWFEARRLGVLFEVNVGTGRLVVTSLNLDPGDGRLAARQFRRSLLRYMASENFAPASSIEGPALVAALQG